MEEIKIAIIEQLPKITEKIKEVGAELEKRLNDLNLDSLVCTEETRKSIKELRTKLGAELKDFENQRKTIKNKINEPYEIFNKAYEEEIKTKYQKADSTLKTKIDEVETGIKNKAKDLAVDFFDEYKKSKSVIEDKYLTFEEINLQIGLDALTEKGALVKKVKDIIIKKVDDVARDIETVRTMENSDEILVEYLKHKNLSMAIKEVNDRHFVLEQVKRDYNIEREIKNKEEQTIEKVEEVLQAPTEEEIDVQMSIDDFGESEQVNEEIYEMTFTVKGTLTKLKELKGYLIKEGFINE